MKITNENDFYFSLLPIFRFSSLLKTFSTSTWLGRSIYLATYLFGAFPYLIDLMAIAQRLLCGPAPIRNKKIHLKAGKAPLQKELKADESLKSRQQKSFGWDSQFEVKEEPHVDRCKDDFAFARLLQEEEDAEEARKLMQAYSKRANKLDRPFAMDQLDKPVAMHDDDDDFAFAQKLQAELYELEDPLTHKDVLSLQDNFLLPKTKALTPRDPLTPKELAKNRQIKHL